MLGLGQMKLNKSLVLNLEQAFTMVSFDINFFFQNQNLMNINLKLDAFSECARNYTRPQGRILSKRPTNCELFISVPENYMITLYFSALEYHLLDGACSDTYMPLKVEGYFG